MFSREEKNKLYKLLKLYNNIQKTKSIAETICVEEEGYFLFEPEEFLRYIVDNEYISKCQGEMIEATLEDVYHKEEAFTNHLQSISKNLALFDIWYINYISEECDSFDEYFEKLEEEFLDSLSQIVKSKEELEIKFLEIPENFEDVEDSSKDAHLIMLSLSRVNLIKENFEALKELVNDSLDLEVITNIEKLLKEEERENG